MPPVLKERANMLKKARDFFFARQILEVDCPILSKGGAIDAHIDLLQLTCGLYLHSSPEYRMKELLVKGSGDIYQLSHVFRKGESGRKHRPEFMMAEWYRLNFSFQQMIEETLDFTRLFLGDLPSEQITYQDAFIKYAGIDPFKEKYDDDFLNETLAIKIEPNLGKNGLTVFTHYPKDQAALAKTDGPYALRFEIYHKGMELANGYEELTDVDEHIRRFTKANQTRRQLGKEEIVIDKTFLKHLEMGLPDCCGVAVGFDRLMMLKLGAQDIAEILPN